MTLESALYAHLTGWPALAALVGARIYRQRAPQGVTVPFLVHTRPDAARFASMGGRGGDEPVITRVQIDAFAATDDATRVLAKAVIRAFDNWVDPDSDPQIFGADVLNDQDDYDDTTQLYRAIIDVHVYHREG